MRLRFKNFINNRTGLYFKDYDLKDLDGIIAERMKACSFDTVLAYYACLTSSEKRDDELRELLNRLTINHTYFFRNEAQFKALKEKVLPEIVARKLSSLRGGPQADSFARHCEEAEGRRSNLKTGSEQAAQSKSEIASSLPSVAPRNDERRAGFVMTGGAGPITTCQLAEDMAIYTYYDI